MGALENPNAINAAAVVVPVPTAAFPAPIVQSRGVASFVRLGPGQYELALEFGLCFADGVPFVTVPANAMLVPSAQITSPGVVRVSVVRFDDGTPEDPAAFFFSILAMQTMGPSPELALAPDPPPAGATLNLYLDPVNGDDANTGRSTMQAIKTPLRLEQLIPLRPGNVDVHMASGAATLPDRGWFMRPRTFDGLVRFIADEAWDPAVFTVIDGNRTAAAATTAVVVKAAGLAVNALQDLSIRFLDGAAAGQYRRVRNNTATDIVPVEAWSPAPAPGDTYQIFQSTARFALPSSGPAILDYVFCPDSPAVGPVGFSSSAETGIEMFSRPLGLLFDGVGLEGGSAAAVYYFGATTVYFYGTDCDQAFQEALYTVAGNGTTFVSGYGSQPYVLKEGWGFAGTVAPQAIRSTVTGCWNISQVMYLYGVTQCHGGRYAAIDSFNADVQAIFSKDVSEQIDPLFDVPFFGIVVRVNSQTAVQIDGGSVLGAIAVTGSGLLNLDSTVVGPGPVSVSEGARLNNFGPVNVGGGGNDWSVFGLPAFNKSFFAASGAVKLGTDGSAAQRL